MRGRASGAAAEAQRRNSAPERNADSVSASPFAAAPGGVAPACARANVSLRDPLSAAVPAAGAVLARCSRQYWMRPTASWQVSATSRHLSCAYCSSSSRHSGVAIAPSASAASWRTMECSDSSASLAASAVMALGVCALRASAAHTPQAWRGGRACICPSAKATSWRQSADGSSRAARSARQVRSPAAGAGVARSTRNAPASSASAASGVPTPRSENRTRKRCGSPRLWSTSLLPKLPTAAAIAAAPRRCGAAGRTWRAKRTVAVLCGWTLSGERRR